jgi:hypothetical protein
MKCVKEIDQNTTYHSRQGADDCGTSCQQHSCHQNIGHDAKNGENQMSGGAKAGTNDFEKSVCVWCSSLKLNSDTGKEKNLDGCSRSIPKWAGNAIVVCHGRALQQSSSPLYDSSNQHLYYSNKARGDLTVHEDTTADATSPDLTVRPAVLNISEV